jgi:hypothetical protein
VIAAFLGLRAIQADLFGSQNKARFRLSTDATGFYSTGQQGHVRVTEEL